MLLGAAVVLALRVPVARGRFRRVALAAAAIVISLVVAFLVTFEPIHSTSGFHAPGMGAVVSEESENGPALPPTFPVGPGGALTFGIDVRNGPNFPIHVLGLADPGLFDVRIVGAGVGTDPEGYTSIPEAAQPFRPFTLDRGEHRNVVVAARGGPCVATSATEERITATLRRVPLVYEGLGVRHVTSIELIEPIVIPIDADCAATARAGEPIPAGTGIVPLGASPIALLALLGLVLAAFAGVSRGRRRMVAAALVPLAIAAGTAGAFLPNLAVNDGRWANGAGYERREAAGFLTNPTWFAIYSGDEGDPMTWGFEVRNPSPVPVTLVGIARPEGDPIGFDLVGVGSQATFERATALPEDTYPFTPVTLEPGGRTFLAIVGRGDACADPASEQLNPVVQFDLVFESLGWRRTLTAQTSQVPTVHARSDGCAFRTQDGSLPGSP